MKSFVLKHHVLGALTPKIKSSTCPLIRTLSEFRSHSTAGIDIIQTFMPLKQNSVSSSVTINNAKIGTGNKKYIGLRTATSVSVFFFFRYGGYLMKYKKKFFRSGQQFPLKHQVQFAIKTAKTKQKCEHVIQKTRVLSFK